jgi:predicted Rossmann fold flavoprotein
MSDLPPACDVAIVGAGAAGLATAIFALRSADDDARSLSVVLLEGAQRPGAKILVSGGTRCNVTNVSVSERDFWGGRPPTIRRILRALPVADTIAFFRDIGVPLHEEADGKLFPDTNRARDVLDALLRAAASLGAVLATNQRVTAINPSPDGFRIVTEHGELRAAAVVLATGGMSLPKSGSDGAGLALATRLGHTLVATSPALDPLVLDTNDRMHGELSGVAHDAELAVWVNGAIAIRLAGALLWTHLGVSGPVALNASRHWLRARLEGQATAITLSFRPGQLFEAADAEWVARARLQPKIAVQTPLRAMLPASVGGALLRELGIDAMTPLAHLSRDDRRRLARALVEWPLPVVATRGYTFAEATAGGVALTEIDPATMESRVCPGLFLVGEMLDADGRLGGFNFQWAWASGFVAGRALKERT